MRFYFGKKCSLPLSHVTRPCITCTNAYEKPIEQIIFIKHINAAVYWSLITGRLQLRDHWTELQSIRHVGRRHPSRHLRLWRTGIPCCVCVCVCVSGHGVISAKFRIGDAASWTRLRWSLSVLHRDGREAWTPFTQKHDLTQRVQGTMDTVSLFPAGLLVCTEIKDDVW